MFGISIPMLVFPGCEEIRAEREDIALAISSAKPTILLALMPALGTNSKRVTMGPDLKSIIFPSPHIQATYFQVLAIIPD